MTTVELQRAGRTRYDGVGGWDLVEATQAGDRDAWAEIWTRYEGVVFRFLLFRLGDRAEAEDLTSETFLKALRKVDKVTYRGSDLGAWLITIARNTFLDNRKCSRTKLEVPVREVADWDPQGVTPPEAAIAAEIGAAIARGVQELTEWQRTAFLHRYVEGLTTGETARLMGVNEGAVKAALHRARVKLMKLLVEHAP